MESTIKTFVLDHLGRAPDATLRSTSIAEELGADHQAVVGVIKSLAAHRSVALTSQTQKCNVMSDEGLVVIDKGSPECRLWRIIHEAGAPVPQPDLAAALPDGVFSVALSNGMKKKWFDVKSDKASGITTVGLKLTAPPSDEARDALKLIQSTNERRPSHVDAAGDVQAEKPIPMMAELLRRKLVSVKDETIFIITRGEDFAASQLPPPVDISRTLMLSGEWERARFRRYNVAARGKPPGGGALHPLMSMRQSICDVFVSLGFQEMSTQQWVESSFWNFDALFVPQQHPARDAQDTFFIERPKFSAPSPAVYTARVREAHEGGYQCAWDDGESRRNVLRTHTTAVSAWVLYHLAQQATADGGAFKPGRYFSIDRVFRNEEMDRTHLCEFHQVEGFVVDKGLSLANMIGILEQFFRGIGVEKLRFKPTYNPYTEPSMEVFGYHEGLKRWIEVGNSGLFRPEMLKPMGFDDDVTAIAWGLSLERPTMMSYSLNNIHQLFGHHVDLNFVKKAPFVVF